MRILIVKTSSMGDVIHALPAVSDLAAAQPSALIDWVVEENFASLARLHPAVRRVLPVALRRWRKHPGSRQVWQELAQFRDQLHAERYDHIIDCQGLVKSALIARWAQGQQRARAGFDFSSAREPIAACFYQRRYRVDRGLHAIERNRRLTALAMGYQYDGPARFQLQAPRLAVGSLRPLNQRYVVLLTNASRATKLWPDLAWSQLGSWLKQQGLQPLLFWGNEAERAATEKRAVLLSGARVAPRSGLDQIAAVLARATLVIGLDTGLTHLAAALGRPTVGVFCDYDPALVGLIGDGACESVGNAQHVPTAVEVIAAATNVIAVTQQRTTEQSAATEGPR